MFQERLFASVLSGPNKPEVYIKVRPKSGPIYNSRSTSARQQVQHLIDFHHLVSSNVSLSLLKIDAAFEW